MPKFAPVCPAQIAAHLAAYNSLGDYHLLLAHDVLNHTDQYEEVFNASYPFTNRHQRGTIIMDNSIIELGDAVDLAVIKHAVDIVKANVVVLPDVLLDAQATVESIKSALPEWSDVFKGCGLMVVPQGKTVEEFAWCAQRLANIVPSNRGWWGIPRNFIGQTGFSRQVAIKICTQLRPHWPIHLLGFSDNLVDDVISVTSRLGNIMGIDSAVPIRLGDAANPRLVEFNQVVEPRGNWWDVAQFSETMCNNVVIMNALVR